MAVYAGAYLPAMIRCARSRAARATKLLRLRFLFRRLLQQPTFFLGVVGEHFRSKWGLAGAPGRNVILFGHRLLWYYRTI